MAAEMTLVEQTLRAQRQSWREIVSRVAKPGNYELPLEIPKRILFFGVGSSHFAARLCAFSLIRDRARTGARLVACSSMNIGWEVPPTRGDWAFAFSHRGRTRGTLEAMKRCHEAGAHVVLVAGQGVEVPDFARMVLPTSPLEKVEPHTMSVSGAICAVTSLLMGNVALDAWDRLSTGQDPDLESLRTRAGSGPSLLLGEWEGEWLAREAALKLMEMARIPIRCYGSEEYFHGPARSLGAEPSIWYVRHPKDLRAGEIKPAMSVSIPEVSPFGWVPALVELQWLALAVALNRGVNPDA